MSLQDAKLILTPNGYKATKIYAVKPTDGSGNATVARNTTKTRVNSSGLIESMAANVLAPDYLNGNCPALNVESQRTNYFRNSFFENGTLTGWSTQNIGVDDSITVVADASAYGGFAARFVSVSGFPGFFQPEVGSFLKPNTRVSLRIKSISTQSGLGSVNIRYGGGANYNLNFPDDGNWHIVSTQVIEGGDNDNLIIESNQSGEFYIDITQAEVGNFLTSFIPVLENQISVTRSADKITRDLTTLVSSTTSYTTLLKVNGNSGTTLDNQSRLIIKDLAGFELPLSGSGNIAMTVSTDKIKFYFPNNGQPQTTLEFERFDSFANWEITTKIGGVGIELISVSDGIQTDFSSWLSGNVSSYYLETNWSLESSFQDEFREETLDYVPLIDTSSGTNFHDAWSNNNLTSFPLIDTSNGKDFNATWYINNLTSFPLINTSSGTNFRFAWHSNDLTSFPLINTSSGTNFFAAWYGNNLTSFPLIDTSSGTNLTSSWRDNNLQTWLPNFFDNCPATDYARCFENNAIDQAGVDNIITSINTARLAGIQVTGQTKELGLNAGTNATPSASVKAIVDDMRLDGWIINLNGY